MVRWWKFMGVMVTGGRLSRLNGGAGRHKNWRAQTPYRCRAAAIMCAAVNIGASFLCRMFRHDK